MNSTKKLQKISENILNIISSKEKVPREADIFLLSHEEMVRLKKKFLPREKGLANILAFPEPKRWPRRSGEKEKLGEIYLNRDLTKGDIGELTKLLIHGTLHLLGYDHKKKGDRIRMEKIEKNVIEKLGY